MHSDRAILDLIELIYAAAGDPTRWSTLLERLSVILEGSAASLHSQNRNSQQASVGASWNIEPALIQQYVEHYSSINPCFIFGKSQIKQGTVKPRRAFCRDEVMLHSEFYNDYSRHLNGFDGAVATIFENGILSTNLTVFRPRYAQSFGDAECKLLETLMPHFQRAFQLHNRIQGLEQRAGATADVLENLSMALVIFDTEGKVLHVNAAASGIFASQTALKVTSRGLLAENPSENQRLQRLIRGAIAVGKGKGLDPGGSMIITRPFKRGLQVLVVPLRLRAAKIGMDVPVAMAFLSDPEREPVSETEAVANLFGLTPAESRLAKNLARGASLKEAAEQLGVAASTVRSQLKSTFAKTGTNRQADLVRLILLSLPEVRSARKESN